jgi:hemoglobin
MSNQNNDRPLYERLGGEDTLQLLVQSFYAKVAKHPELAPIFPDDLTLTAEKQHQFLTQFFGGPPLYTQEHGHPMLRARHMPFPITPKRAEAWLSCMNETLNELDINEEVKQEMLSRLTFTAHHMINTPD